MSPRGVDSRFARVATRGPSVVKRVAALGVALGAALVALVATPVGAQPSDPVRPHVPMEPRGPAQGADPNAQNVAHADAPPASAAALYSSARAAEREFDYVAARDAYGRILAAHPTHRLVSRARRRIAWIDARATSAVALAHLGELMQWRDAPASASAVRARAAELASWPTGQLRREGYAALAHAALALDAPELAEERARAYVAELEGDSAASESERFESLQLLARALGAQTASGPVAVTGEGAHQASRAHPDASAELDALLAGPLAGSELAQARVDARRRARGRAFVLVALALWALILLALLARALRAAPEPRLLAALRSGLSALVLPAVVLLGPTLIASAYDHDASDTFWVLWPALLGVLGPSYVAFAALEPDARRERGVLGAATVLALGGAAYLVLLTRGLAVLGLGA